MACGKILSKKKTSMALVKNRASDSRCWKSIMKVKDFYMAGRGIKINKGDLARLWDDNIDAPKKKISVLYDICLYQNCNVVKMETLNPVSSFRRCGGLVQGHGCCGKVVR